MKIGVIGANGKSGNLISQEAANRGHEVVAFVRDKGKLLGKNYSQVIERDLFDMDANDLQGLNAIVCAVSLSMKNENDHPYQNAIEHLIGIIKNLPNIRLLMVGGAASLYTDPHKKRPFLELIPEQWKSMPEDMAKAYAMLSKSDINWTFFSPAVTFDPKGKRTGKYTIGSDFIITNASNESYISYEDYAIAMVDEIENKFHERRRFTAVSDSKPEDTEKQDTPPKSPSEDEGYYGIMKEKPEYYGLSRYAPPLNYELAGKQFRLVMDKEDDFFVNFLTGNILEWSKLNDQEIARLTYECAKIDDLTYFVNFGLLNSKPDTNITLILDMEQRLVTYVRSYTGFNAKYPYLVESDFDFGAIDIPGYPLPKKRHDYTTDLVGKRVHWFYSPKMSLVHVYYSPNYIRVASPPGRPNLEIENPESDFYDEPTTYIKIKEGIYLVNVIEQNRSRKGDTGNSLLFLMDLVHVHDIGRSFGHTPPHLGEIKIENYLFSAFGDFVYSDGVIESRKKVNIEA